MVGTEYIDPRFRANGERLADGWAVEDEAVDIEAESLRARLAGRPSGLAERIGRAA